MKKWYIYFFNVQINSKDSIGGYGFQGLYKTDKAIIDHDKDYMAFFRWIKRTATEQTNYLLADSNIEVRALNFLHEIEI